MWNLRALLHLVDPAMQHLLAGICRLLQPRLLGNMEAARCGYLSQSGWFLGLVFLSIDKPLGVCALFDRSAGSVVLPLPAL